MAEVTDALMKRIRALLAMSRGNANENEANTAARKVQELMVEYNLSLSDIEAHGGTIIEDGDLMTSSSNPWRRSLGTAVAMSYLCDYYWGHVRVYTDTRERGYVRLDKHFFIGLAHNVVVAKEMFVYLVDTIERLAKKHRKAWVKLYGRRRLVDDVWISAIEEESSFRFGCSKRIEARLMERYHEMTNPPAGLLVHSNVPALYKGMDARLSEYMERNHNDLVTIDRYAGRVGSIEGVAAGARAGDEVSLDTQLSGEQQLLITKQ